MIITKTVKIEINKGNIPYYKKFEEYKNLKIGDIAEIKIENLSKSCKATIQYKCDNCGKILETKYCSYCDPRRDKKLDLCKGKCANIKRENTNEELYGVKNCFQNYDKKDKAKDTMIKKYGVDHNMKTKKCLDDRKKTYLKNYGVDNPSKSKIIKEKKEKTCLINFGVKSPLQNSDVFKRNRLSAYRINNYNETITYQGSYEFDFLNTYYDKILIINPNFTINYTIDDISHKYHPDFYCEDYNLIVEIKSDYTYNKEIDKNLAKEKYSLLNGYNFIFIINKDYFEFNMIIGN